MDGREFTRRVKRYAKSAGLEFRFVSGQGKGSHGMLYLDGRMVVVKRSELSKGLLAGMLKELRIPKERF